MTLWRLLTEYHVGLLAGVRVTLSLCAIIWTSSLLLGVPIGFFAALRPRAIGWSTRALSFLLAATPVLLMLYYLTYPVQEVLRINASPFATAAVGLSLYSVFAVADLTRLEISSFPRQYLAAATVLGVSQSVTLRRIWLPLVARRVTPGLLVIAVTGLQSTLFAAFVSVEEIFRVCLRVNATEHLSVHVFSLVTLFFIAICLPLHGLAFVLGRRFAADGDER